MTKELKINFCDAADDPSLTKPRPLVIADVGAVVDASMAAARKAFEQSRGLSVSDRVRVVRKFRNTLATHAADLARELAIEANRPPEEFLSSEIIPLLDACRFLEKNASRVLRERGHDAFTMPLWLFGTNHEIIREPLGIILIIGASNYPLFLPGVQVLQALVAGNAVLLKPAPASPHCAEALQRLLIRSGLSEDLLQVLPSVPEAATHAIRRQVDKVFLTGSADTGRKVLIHAATTITPAVVELSGCDAAFVLPDADLDLAARCLAFGLTLNSGHTCIAPRRAFVWDEISTLFMKKLQQALAERPKTFTRAPASSEFAINLREATAEGAIIINGGFCENEIIGGPLVVANLNSTAAFAMAENWGPNLSIITVSDEAEALAGCEKSRLALGASIFSQSTATASRLASRVQAGSVCINDLIVPTADGRLPFSGRKQSGFGVTRGPEGLLEMTAPKVISTRRRSSHFHLLPPAKNQFQLLSAYSALAYSSGFSRLRAIGKLFSALPREPVSNPKDKML